MPYLPKRMIRCLVVDSSVTAAINAIIKANQTGNIGDGKVFVRSLSAVAGGGEVREAAAAAGRDAG